MRALWKSIHTTLRYYASPGKIKEEVVLDARGDFTSYSMNMNTAGLTAERAALYPVYHKLKEDTQRVEEIKRSADTLTRGQKRDTRAARTWHRER